MFAGETLSVAYDEINTETLLSGLGVGLIQQNIIFQDRGVKIPLVKLQDPELCEL